MGGENIQWLSGEKGIKWDRRNSIPHDFSAKSSHFPSRFSPLILIKSRRFSSSGLTTVRCAKGMLDAESRASRFKSILADVNMSEIPTLRVSAATSKFTFGHILSVQLIMPLDFTSRGESYCSFHSRVSASPRIKLSQGVRNACRALIRWDFHLMISPSRALKKEIFKN